MTGDVPDYLQRGDELVARIEAETVSEATRTADTTQLLSCLFAGYPIERIRVLLQSENQLAVRSGAFLLSEMPDRAAPLLDEVRQLLDNPDPWVRHDAISVILIAATASSGQAIAQAIRLIGDDHPAIREDVMRLLAHATKTQLRAGLAHLDTATARLTSWLLDATPDGVGADLPGLLDDPDPQTRRFAAAAAVRHVGTGAELLSSVSKVPDNDIATFISRELKLSKIRVVGEK